MWESLQVDSGPKPTLLHPPSTWSTWKSHPRLPSRASPVTQWFFLSSIPPIVVLTVSQGTPCDRYGNFLPPETPPTPPLPKSNDDWTPFTSQEGFKLAEILYLKAHLLQSIIDQLLDVWSATLIPHDDLPPITSHQDLHA